MLLGGESRYTLQRVVDYCEGWFPRSRRPELVTQGMNALREYAARAGRDGNARGRRKRRAAGALGRWQTRRTSPSRDDSPAVGSA